MKKLIAAISLFFAAVLFSGCTILDENDRSGTHYVYTGEEDGKIVFYGVTSSYGYGSSDLTYDPQSGTLSFRERTEEFCFADPAVLNGNTFPRYIFEAAEGYENLTDKLRALAGREDPFVQAYALEAEDGTAYGFCNIYSSATGMLSGGGQIGVKKITRGVLFTYSPSTDELTVTDEIGKGCVVAFNQTHCIYFYNRSYYCKEIGKEGAIKLCDDGAYDTGITGYSYANFYFNEVYCVIMFHRGYNNSKKDYDEFLLFTMNGEKLSELHIPSKF